MFPPRGVGGGKQATQLTLKARQIAGVPRRPILNRKPPHFPAPSFFISLFYTTPSPPSLHIAFPKLSIPCELFGICEMPTCSPDTQTDSTSLGNLRRLSHTEYCVVLRAVDTGGITSRLTNSSFLFHAPGAATNLAFLLLTLQCKQVVLSLV